MHSSRYVNLMFNVLISILTLMFSLIAWIQYRIWWCPIIYVIMLSCPTMKTELKLWDGRQKTQIVAGFIYFILNNSVSITFVHHGVSMKLLLIVLEWLIVLNILYCKILLSY